MAEKDVALFQLENVEPTQKIVGSGAYGRVIEVTTRSAAKELHRVLTNFASPQELARLQQKFLAECYQCSKLCHPNIVQFLGIYYPSEDAKLPWLVMEKMDCSLHEYLNVHKSNEVSFQTRISILHDVTLGLQYLHVQDIIHRDLSSNNILLTKQLVAKIADLGVAKVIDPNRAKSHTQAPGTVVFMPPEALLVKPVYGKPVDVFSLGCVTIHVMTHKWPAPKDEVDIDKITGKKTVREEVERREDYLELIQEPKQLKQLIVDCLNHLPERRPSISYMSKVFRELKPDLKSGKMYSILFEYESLKDELAARDEQLDAVQRTKVHLLSEIHDLKSKNDNLSEEISRLIGVDRELAKAKETIKHAEDDLATKEFIIQTYKEDFQQEQKDRENAHNIKEEEIEKIRVEKEELIANHNDVIKHVQENYQAKIDTYSRRVEQLTIDINKLSQENARLLAALEKQEKEAQNKADLYKNKTEQFQAQWRKREEVEKVLKDLTDQLNAQCRLNADQQNTINDLMRKNKGIDNKTPTNVSGTPVDTTHKVSQYARENDRLNKECDKLKAEVDKAKKDAQGKLDVYKRKTEQFQEQWIKREEAEARVTTLTEQLNAQCELNKQLNSTIDSMMRKAKGIDPQMPSSNIANQQNQQRRVSPFSNVDTPSDQYHSSTTMSKPSSYDSSTYINAGMAFQQQPQRPPPPSSTSQQAWQMHQEQQHFYKMQQQQQQEQLYLRGQGRGPLHNQPLKPLLEGTHPLDYQGQGKKGIKVLPPTNIDNYQYQPRLIQEYERFDSPPPFDPYLTCPKCKLQFREGQLPEYRHHIHNCNQ